MDGICDQIITKPMQPHTFAAKWIKFDKGHTINASMVGTLTLASNINASTFWQCFTKSFLFSLHFLDAHHEACIFHQEKLIHTLTRLGSTMPNIGSLISSGGPTSGDLIGEAIGSK